MDNVRVQPGMLASIRGSIDDESDGIGGLIGGLSRSAGPDLTLGPVAGGDELCTAIMALGAKTARELQAAKQHLHDVSSSLDTHRAKVDKAEDENTHDAQRAHADIDADGDARPLQAGVPSTGQDSASGSGQCEPAASAQGVATNEEEA